MPVVDVGDLDEVVGRLFEDLDRERPLDRRPPPGIFTPTLDAFETDAAVEIVVDLPGTAPDDDGSSSAATWSSWPDPNGLRCPRNGHGRTSIRWSATSGASRAPSA